MALQRSGVRISLAPQPERFPRYRGKRFLLADSLNACNDAATGDERCGRVSAECASAPKWRSTRSMPFASSSLRACRHLASCTSPPPRESSPFVIASAFCACCTHSARAADAHRALRLSGTVSGHMRAEIRQAFFAYSDQSVLHITFEITAHVLNRSPVEHREAGRYLHLTSCMT